MSDDAPNSLTPSTALIVSAFLKKSHVQAVDLPALLSTVHSALANAGGAAPVPPQEPAVPLRRLVTAGKVFCAECGKGFKSMRRHLGTSHHLTASAYIAKWGLKKDHPMVAPETSAIRSKLALAIGLGRKAAPKTAKAPVVAKGKAPAKVAEAKAPGKAVGAAPAPTKTKATRKAKPAAAATPSEVASGSSEAKGPPEPMFE